MLASHFRGLRRPTPSLRERCSEKPGLETSLQVRKGDPFLANLILTGHLQLFLNGNSVLATDGGGSEHGRHARAFLPAWPPPAFFLHKRVIFRNTPAPARPGPAGSILPCLRHPTTFFTKSPLTRFLPSNLPISSLKRSLMQKVRYPLSRYFIFW